MVRKIRKHANNLNYFEMGRRRQSSGPIFSFSSQLPPNPTSFPESAQCFSSIYMPRVHSLSRSDAFGHPISSTRSCPALSTHSPNHLLSTHYIGMGNSIADRNAPKMFPYPAFHSANKGPLICSVVHEIAHYAYFARALSDSAKEDNCIPTNHAFFISASSYPRLISGDFLRLCPLCGFPI
jgi:hypothetical protein